MRRGYIPKAEITHWLRYSIRQLIAVSVAERSKASVYGRSLAGIAGSNPAEGTDVCLLWV
jgi:hypothetical protein